jgi:acyl-homoserine lactone acylase PvdQ
MRWHKAPPCARGTGLLACLLLLAAFTASAAQPPVTIYRDTYGVPHIYGKTDASVVFGLMYAQAEDNFWQLEEDYIRALGRAAEVDGPRGLAADILARAWLVCAFTAPAAEAYCCPRR